MTGIINRYPIGTQPSFTLLLPAGHKILSCQTQRNLPYMFILIDDELPDKVVHFHTVPTDLYLQDYFLATNTYIGTVKLNDDTLIYHVFEETS